MIKNYLLTALRNIRRNPLYATLNIAGLGVGLASAILILLWVVDEWSYDRFHSNLDNIYVTMHSEKQGGETFTYQSIPAPLAAGLRADIPEIARAARGNWAGSHLMSVGEKGIYERAMYVEADFLNIFKFPSLMGDAVAALKDINSVVLTERTAKKFFGEENPIGKVIRHDGKDDLKVAAVLKDIPRNSSVRFDVLLPFAIFEKERGNINAEWGDNSIQTWVELRPNTNLAALNHKLEGYLATKAKGITSAIIAYPFERYRLWNRFKNGKEVGGRIDTLRMLGILGVFMLLIACINFMNLSTARSEKRAREVGVRKVLGAFRSMLIGQFLSEALVMTFLGLGFALLLTYIVLPEFNLFFNKKLALSLDNWGVWVGVLAIGLIVGLISGSYPAFYLSQFNPAKVIKSGTLSTNKKGSGIRTGLVTFQFGISIFLIISTIVFLKQLDFAQNLPIGYDQENLISVHANGTMPKTYETVKNDLLQLKSVKSVSTSNTDLLMYGQNTTGIQWNGKTDDQDFAITISWVGLDWVKTAGLKLAQGRDFSAEYGSDTLSCILNQTAVKRMGLKEPIIGQVIRHDTTTKIIGVVEDYVFNNPLSKTAPVVIYHDRTGMSNFFIRVENDNNIRQNVAQIEQIVKKHNPTYPIQANFTKEDYQANFNEIKFTGKLARLFGGLAIFISCLGLFGLSVFLAERRRKEIGIRKVLGASISHVCLQLSKDFFKPVVLAFVLATPFSIWAMQKVLDEMEYHINLEWWMFAVAGLLALLIALVTVSFQGIKAALANPVKSLRTE